MADIQALLSALDVFSRAPDKASLDTANRWLQDFQHSPEAWTTCNVILLSPDAPPDAKFFAAQTFRAKVTYDLGQVDAASIPLLRDSFLEALKRYHAGPRNILGQLCLAIAGFVLQVPSWENPVQTMIDTFGRNPVTVPALLRFLTLLPEELIQNNRIPVTDQEWKERSRQLLSGNVGTVLDLLSMYIQAPGITHSVQAQVFSCLQSWLEAGEISAISLAKTSLFTYTFDALESDHLFDIAVDVLCEIIHETQEIEDNMSVIELIVPRLTAMKVKLFEHKDDPEKIRGYARIFTEAGETYRILLLEHTETFFPIVEAIGECSAYSDLDIVPITFPFWMRIAQIIGKKPSVPPLFVDAYKTLMGVIIRHLHFPADSNALRGQEAESFRSFRHVMGDTLKDCCYVLGTDACLLATYQMITTAIAHNSITISWQEIEAPLFAMRSMGAEIDTSDSVAVPKIMDLIPTLPNHPKIRYAALLILSRYTEWVDFHPDYIPHQLQYISSGFEDVDDDVCAAASQALKYLCKDCKGRLVEFLPRLHTFLSTTGKRLIQDDRKQVYEAIGYVISSIPMEQAAEVLRNFATDILAQVRTVASKSSPATKQELQEVGNGLENLEILLHIVGTYGDELPPACHGTCIEVWSLFDIFLAKYALDYDMAERSTRVIRHGLNLFGSAALPVASSVIARMSTAFEASGYPSYLWIAGKTIGRFGNEEEPMLRTAFLGVYERSTNKVVALLQEKSPGNIPDVLEDYVQMLLQMIELTPDIFFQSSAFPVALRAAMAALTLVHTDVVFASLELFRVVLMHDCLSPSSSTTQHPKFPIYATAIKSFFTGDGLEFVGYIFGGLVGDFPEDATAVVVSIIRVLADIWSVQLLSWLPSVLRHLPTTSAPEQAKTQLLQDMNTYITSGQYDKVKYAIISFHRASRKARERRRTVTMDR